MFLPKKSKIFENLVKLSSIIEEAAQVFQKITHDWEYLKNGSEDLVTLESQADTIVHTITDDIERIFILPLDKEDIKELTDKLDDIIDGIEQAANRLYIYKILKSNKAIKEFSELILKAVQQIHQGILIIKEHKFHSKDFVAYQQKLHELENDGDKLHRKVLGDMMGKSSDFNRNETLSIIKWREIFQTLEDTLDICEDIAINFDKLRIKYM